ncbi:pyrroline-5-carboxylate reductase [Candidatus Auribacterota bacterium]
MKNNILKTKKIGFIGAGNMGGALIDGIVDAGLVNPECIIAYDKVLDKQDSFKKQGVKCAKDIDEVVNTSDIVILAVKPQDMEKVLDEASKSMGIKDKLFISIAAGVRILGIEKKLIGAAVIRSMPNLPASVKSGITAIAKGTNATDEDMKTAEAIFKSVGDVIVEEEEMIDTVTALSGSGPAYVFYFMEGMIEAGQKLGLSKENAAKLALKTVEGAVNILKESEETPESLRKKVTSPGGTTEAAIKHKEENRFKEIFIEAIEKAKKRAEELSK